MENKIPTRPPGRKTVRGIKFNKIVIFSLSRKLIYLEYLLYYIRRKTPLRETSRKAW